jgi:hypothetical protein
VANQKSQPAQPPPKTQNTTTPSADIPAFQQTTTRAFGLGNTTSEVRNSGQQPSLFGAHRERLDAQTQAAREKPQKASIYAKDIEAFKLGNEQERARTGGPSR